MPYPHQPGSPWFDGADAFEAYLDDQERLTLAVCETCAGDGCIRRLITVYEHGCGFPHDDVEEQPCPDCGGSGEIAVQL